MKYEIIVAGTIVAKYDNKVQAEEHLSNLRNSIFGLIHPTECMWIKEIED